MLRIKKTHWCVPVRPSNRQQWNILHIPDLDLLITLQIQTQWGRFLLRPCLKWSKQIPVPSPKTLNQSPDAGTKAWIRNTPVSRPPPPVQVSITPGQLLVRSKWVKPNWDSNHKLKNWVNHNILPVQEMCPIIWDMCTEKKQRHKIAQSWGCCVFPELWTADGCIWWYPDYGQRWVRERSERERTWSWAVHKQPDGRWGP